MSNTATQTKPASKIKKGDWITDEGKTVYVVKKGKGFGSDEVKFTVSDWECGPEDAFRYWWFPKDYQVQLGTSPE